MSSVALVLSIGFTALTATSSAFAAETFKISTQSLYHLQNASELDTVLKQEGLSQKQLAEYGEYVKEESSKGPTKRWKGAALKKVIKFTIDHVETIPSKTLREGMKKYGNKVINAIDTIKVYSWYGIASALVKAGVPNKYANLIADFIVKFLLKINKTILM